MKYLVFALTILAAPVHADSDLCANARTAEAAFRVLHTGLEHTVTACRGETSQGCQAAREALDEYENTARGMGIVAANWTRRQACED